MRRSFPLELITVHNLPVTGRLRPSGAKNFSEPELRRDKSGKDCFGDFRFGKRR